MQENTIVTEEGTSVLWDMLTDEQKAAILAINAAAKDNNTALFEMADGLAANIGLRDLVHFDRSLHADGNIALLKAVSNGKAVDRCCKHAHMIGTGAFHTVAAVLETAPDVAAADNDGYLYACVDALLDDVTDRADD